MEKKNPQNEMSFLGHLEELRWKLMKSAIAIIIVACVLFYYTTPVIEHIYLASCIQFSFLPTRNKLEEVARGGVH